MNEKNKAKQIINELNDFCNETGQFDRACQMEWLLANYPDVFKHAIVADRWLSIFLGNSEEKKKRGLS